jgi:hypothetical protein
MNTNAEETMGLKTLFKLLHDIVLPLGTDRSDAPVKIYEISEEMKNRTAADALFRPIPFPELKK